MILRSLIICLISILIASTASAANILIIGDSVSAGYGINPKNGWVALLQQRINRLQCHYDVTNASFTGDTSSNGLGRLPKALAQHEPNVVILAIGANDGLRGLDPKNLQKNLSEMASLSKAAGAKVLIVAAPLPRNLGGNYIKRYHAAYENAADSNNVPLVTRVFDDILLNPNLTLKDRVHPNEKAQPIILNNVWGTLEDVIACY